METPPRLDSSKTSMVSSPMSNVYLHHLLPVKRYVSHFSKSRDRKPADDREALDVAYNESINSSNCDNYGNSGSGGSSSSGSSPESVVVEEDAGKDSALTGDHDVGESEDFHVDNTGAMDGSANWIANDMNTSFKSAINSEGEADDPTEDELYMRSLESRADELSRNLRDIFRERDKLKKDVWIKEKELAALRSELGRKDDERERAKQASFAEIESKIGVIMNHYIQLNEIYLSQESNFEKNREYFDSLLNDVNVLNANIKNVTESTPNCSSFNKEGSCVVNKVDGTNGQFDSDRDGDNDDNIYLIALSHKFKGLQNELFEELTKLEECKTKIDLHERYVQYLRETNSDLVSALRFSHKAPKENSGELVSYSMSEKALNFNEENGLEHPPCNFIKKDRWSPPVKDLREDERSSLRRLKKKRYVQRPTFTSIHRRILQTKLKEKRSNEHVKEKSIHGSASFIPSGNKEDTKNLIASNSQFHRQKLMLETATSSPLRAPPRYYDDDVIRLVYKYYNEVIE